MLLSPRLWSTKQLCSARIVYNLGSESSAFRCLVLCPKMLSQVASSTPANVILRGARRTLSTAVQQSTSSRPPPFVTRPGKQTSQKHHGSEEDGGLPSLWIRPWDGILSMADGLAVLRAIERRYGKLKYYHFLRVRHTSAALKIFTK